MPLPCVTKARTAFLSETNRIAVITERMLKTGDPDYFLNRIPETSYDTSMGHNPRSVRVTTSPPIRTEYQTLMAPAGSRSVSYPDPLSDGAVLISGNANKNGNICNIPGETIDWGYEEFGRCLRGTALETAPICVLEVLEKKAVGATIEKLRQALPRYGKEHFGNELRRQVIRHSYRKYSVADGFPTSTRVPYFPAIPTGGASIGHIRRMENFLRREGWNEGSKTPVVNGRPALQVLMGRDSIEWAIREDLRTKGVVIQRNSVTENDATFGSTEVYNGIQFIEDQMPTRGYVVEVAPGLFEFREIQPVFVEAGVEGIVTRANPAYDQAFVVVRGETHIVLEVGYVVHPRAMERQALGSIPKVDGKPVNKMMNFEVNMVPDWALTADPRCNKDQLYVAYRMTHAYAPLPYNPELMTAFLYIAATPQYSILSPNRPEGTAILNPITMQPFAAPKEGGCATCTDPVDSRVQIAGTCDAPIPTNGVGVIQFDQITYYVDESAGNITIVVERVGGNVGAASVNYTTVAGTATQPANYTTTAGTLNWADGAGGIKTFVVPINTRIGDDEGRKFTVVLSSVVGATLTPNTTATVNLLDADEHPVEE